MSSTLWFRTGWSLLGLHRLWGGGSDSWLTLSRTSHLLAEFLMFIYRSNREGRADPYSPAAPSPCLWSCASKHGWQPDVPYCTCWWMNKQMSAAPQVPACCPCLFVKVTFISLSTKENSKACFPTASRTFVSFASVLRSLFSVPLMTGAGCFVLSHNSQLNQPGNAPAGRSP